MQLAHTGRGVELSRIAGACDLHWSGIVADMADVVALRARVHAQDGTTFAVIKIAPNEPPRILPPRDGVFVKNRFRATLGHATI